MPTFSPLNESVDPKKVLPKARRLLQEIVPPTFFAERTEELKRTRNNQRGSKKTTYDRGATYKRQQLGHNLKLPHAAGYISIPASAEVVVFVDPYAVLKKHAKTGEEFLPPHVSQQRNRRAELASFTFERSGKTVIVVVLANGELILKRPKVHTDLRDWQVTPPLRLLTEHERQLATSAA